MKHLLTAILLLAFAHTAAGERNVSLERDFGTLYGTLLTPDAGTETVAVIIAGSGPTPRNGNVNSYLYLAQALEKAGIASLRYDKRGIGASRFTEPEKMADAVLGDFIGDAAAWADYLAGEGFRRVVLIGHSEGALIAFCAAQQTPKVAAVVSLAGAGYPLDEILQLQLASQLLPDNMDLLLQANAITAGLLDHGLELRHVIAVHATVAIGHIREVLVGFLHVDLDLAATIALPLVGGVQHVAVRMLHAAGGLADVHAVLG